MSVEYHPAVEAELKAIQRYYEHRSPGLGVRFTDEFERQVLELAARPERWMVATADIRRCLMKRFPYIIYFRRVDPERIRITVVKARAIWSTNVLLLLVGVGTVVGLVPRPHEMKVTVAFCGYSNNSRGTRLAKMKVRNEGSVTIRRCRQYTVDERQQSRVFSVHCFLSDNILLAPGESEVVEIFPTPDLGEWRAGFLCLPCGWKMWLRDRIEPMRMTDPSWKWRLYRLIAPTNTPINSEWIAAHDDAAQRPALDCSLTTRLHFEKSLTRSQ